MPCKLVEFTTVNLLDRRNNPIDLWESPKPSGEEVVATSNTLEVF